MSDSNAPDWFDEAFHRSADRHERVWLFVSVALLTLMMIGAMFYVVEDYGLVTQAASYNGGTETPEMVRAFQQGKVVQTDPNAYSVYITGHLWAWSPSPVHVKQGAQVTFNVTSADVLHGFEVQGTPINLTAVPGMVGTVTYRFRHAGTYYIICNEYCGVEHQAMVGQIIVDPQET